jgi:hypothetical protein
MFTSGGKWSSDTKCGGKRSGGYIDVNGGVSKGGSLIVTHHEYPSNTTRGGGYSTGGGSGTSESSYSSLEQHIQQVCTSLGGDVLGGAYHDQRKNRDKDDGINYQVKGIVSQLNYYGFKDPKGIVLSDCALEDRDISLYSSFVQTLQHHPFNLTIIDLSNNKLGIDAVEGIFYLTRVDHVLPKHVQCINLSNNLLDDNCAEHIANYLKQGVHPSLKRLDVSGNNMSWESNALFAQAAINIRQDIKILINKVLPISSITSGVKKQSDFFFGSKEEKHAIIKDYLKHAQSNGVDVQNVAVSKSIFETIKNGASLGKDFAIGFIKCNIVPEDATSFAAGAIVAKISKKATGVIAATDAVACYFEAYDESATSQEGIQFMLDAGIVTTTDLLGNVE